MNVELEYGQGTVNVTLPDTADIFIPGETVADPPYIPEDQLVEKTLESIRNPMGMEPLSRLAKKGSKITIVFPDRVKGGEQPTSHRRISIKLILQELYDAGVEKEDILLICSNGLHRKNTEKEIRNVLGEELFHQFWYTHQIINHDSEDYDHLVDLGTTGRGDPVLMNKYVYDSDVAILIGHTQGNPYGGYSGGYKHCATGITHWRSIASHHVPEVMHRKDFTPVSGKSLMRTKFDEIGMHMEERMGKKFFCCDAVLDTKSRQIEINSGYGAVMQPHSWVTADKRTYVPWAEKKYDVMIFGMPQFFHYGDGMGTNPIMLMQAISAQVIRHKRVMSDNCVIICTSACNGYFHDELWPYLREMYEMFQHDQMNTLPDMNRLGEYFATNEEYIRKYRFANAFHPFHGFSMISCAHIAEMNTSAVYLCGAQEPGYARGMGLKTRETVEEALEDAKKKFVGPNPNILVLPRTFKLSAVHLAMKGESVEGMCHEDRGCAHHHHK
ncbi:lactate racemase domain-containing protein [Lachnospiraceae bacterium 54-53]